MNNKLNNTTFTKRVDHEAGRHRPARAQSEPSICALCGAVYKKRRWVANDDAPIATKAAGLARVTLCPGCKSRKEGVPSGYLQASGDFLAAHRDDIEHLLRNEAARAAEDNPLGQIIDWKGKGSILALTTTTEHLVQRLGHALEKAFDGKVKYDFSHENKLARVSWHRD